MARTISEINEDILTAIAATSGLTGLTSTSNAAIYKLLAYVVAVAIHVFEGLQDVFKAEVETIAADAVGGSLRWYKSQVFKWQYDDILEWVDDKFQYDVDDEAARIVTQCSVVETGRQLTVKVAKGETGSLEALSSDEKTSLLAYLNNIKVAGTTIVLTSESADDLKFYASIYYNPIKSLATVQDAVETAIENHLQSLSFDAVLKVSTLIDIIQSVEGVTDIVFESASAKYGSNSYVSFNRVYGSNAGYLTIDSAFPLSSTITYIAE